jgi:hypothetical protein
MFNKTDFLYIRTHPDKKRWMHNFVVSNKKERNLLKRLYPDMPFSASMQELEKKIFDKSIPQEWKSFNMQRGRKLL